MKVEIHKGADNLWYWRVRARNGEILCNSEGYKHLRDAKRMARKVTRRFLNVVVSDSPAPG